MSMLHSNSRSSALRSDSKKATLQLIASRITSGQKLKRRNGFGGSALDLRPIRRRYHWIIERAAFD